MRNLKRALSLVMAAAMLIGMMVVSAGAVDYADQADIDYTEAVGVMSAIEVLEGNGKNFNPDGILTREQAAKIITYVVMGKTKAEKLPASANFTDVKATDWAAKYIAYCAGKNIIAGDGTGKFNPKGELTGFAFGKMLLVALGFDPAACGLTGSAWEINTSTLLAAEKLDAGLENVVLSNPMTREQAAQMALNAMKWSTTPDTYNVVKGTAVVGTYATLAEATREAALLNALTDSSDYTTAKASATDTLLKTVFNVDAGTLTDDFGRPGNSYALNDDAGTVLKYSATPVATFNTAMTEAGVFAAIGAAGIQGSEDKYIVMDKIYEDGAQVAAAQQIGSTGQYEATASGGINNTVVITKATDGLNNAAGFGNGVNVEIYATDTANHYIMVAYREYLGTITGVTAANALTGAKRTVTIAGVGSFATDSFNKSDVVLYTKNSSGIASMKAPTAISGTVTKITNSSVYTIGGVDYKLSQTNALSPISVNTTGSWYLDSCGNLIDEQTVAPATKYYGVALEVGQIEYSAGTLIEASKDTYEAVKFIDSTGSVVVLDTAWTQTYDANGNIAGQTFKASALKTAVADAPAMFQYTLTAEGKIDNIVLATDSSASVTLTTGSATTSGTYAGLMTDKTVVFLTDGTNTTVYTGYANVPNKSGTFKSYFTANSGAAWAAMYVQVSDVAVSTAADYIYFASTANTVETTTSGTVTTYTDVYVNGAKVEGGKVLASGTPAAGALYTFTADTKTGAITLTSANLIGTPVEITSAQATYFVAGTAVYTDANTAYYEVDTVNNTITVSTGLPALSTNDAYSVNLLYKDAAGTVTDGANIVVYSIGA